MCTRAWRSARARRAGSPSWSVPPPDPPHPPHTAGQPLQRPVPRPPPPPPPPASRPFPLHPPRPYSNPLLEPPPLILSSLDPCPCPDQVRSSGKRLQTLRRVSDRLKGTNSSSEIKAKLARELKLDSEVHRYTYTMPIPAMTLLTMLKLDSEVHRVAVHRLTCRRRPLPRTRYTPLPGAPRGGGARARAGGHDEARATADQQARGGGGEGRPDGAHGRAAGDAD